MLAAVAPRFGRSRFIGAPPKKDRRCTSLLYEPHSF
jgi:hypothetical protein